MARVRNRGYRFDAMWIAAMIHRLSGLALALFLPIHFLVLGLAIENTARLDAFLTWTKQPAVKLAEVILVALLVVHALGGLRLLVVEMATWFPNQKRIVGLVLGASALVAIGYLLIVV